MEGLGEVLKESGFLIGVKPLDRWVMLEPGHLFPGIDPTVALDLLDRYIKCPFATQVVEQLLIPHRVQCVQRTVGIDSACLFQQALFHHLIHTSVDAVVELFPVTGQSDLDNPERTALDGMGAKGGVGFTGHPADLDSMDHPLVVLPIHLLVVFRIGGFQLLQDRGEALLGKLLVNGFSDLRGNGGNVIDPFADGVDIHHGASTHDDVWNRRMKLGQ